MDFQFSEEQNMLRELARDILNKEITPESLKAVEAEGTGYSRTLWQKLAAANLLGLAIAEEHGGMGFGILELCVLAEEAGRCVAPLPIIPCLFSAGLAIARFGNKQQQAKWLSKIARGETILSAALDDSHSSNLEVPATLATQNEDYFELTGEKRFVAAAQIAERILIPASCNGKLALFLVDPKADGVETLAAQTSTSAPLCTLQLHQVKVPTTEKLGDANGVNTGAGQWLWDVSTIGVCATQLGVSSRAIEITTKYLSEREQFGAPIGTFPAVQQRAADRYIDLECMRWTYWSAAWRLASGLPASSEVAVAKFWASEAGSRIANTTQHQHGGIGTDIDYPIHRYFLWAKQLELSFGSATSQLARLGKEFASNAPQETL